MEFDRSTVGKIVLAAGVGFGLYVVYKTVQSRRTEQWVKVGTISELMVYPIKSCKGRSVPDVECLTLGLKHGEYLDRRFVIADPDGKFLTAREAPKLVLVECNLKNDVLTLTAPGKNSISTDLNKTVANGKVMRIKLWSDMPIDAFDCGDDIANWFHDYLGMVDGWEHFRLCYHTPGLFNSRSLNNWEEFKGLFDGRKDMAIFPDLTPYMLMTESSVADLNTRTPNGEQFSIKNFRPNFIVAGTKAFDEDRWDKVRIGEQTLFTNIKPCTRCLLTTINWATGEKHPRSEPLRTLRSYRVCRNPDDKKFLGLSPMLGTNLTIERLGRVQVGDPVYVTYRSGKSVLPKH